MNEVLAEMDGEVLVLTLNRPEKANAMNEAMQNSLVEFLANSKSKAVVLAAAGPKIFSAGADLKEFSELERSIAARRRRVLLKRTLDAILDYPGPLIAAVQGKALGAGAMVALLADELVMADTAELGLPEIRHGIPTPVGYAIVAARGGMPLARRMVQDGEPVGPGLADFVSDVSSLKQKALERAAVLAANPGPSYQSNKKFINAPLKAALHAAFAQADRL
ncbi:MAG: enoyl-CoA hydratase/isomerase family protein [Betaproteobacteria bacterium]|nr:enoyl-CoA hydratase/isomerase family protein [Betaproteobacteria bacterium]